MFFNEEFQNSFVSDRNKLNILYSILIIYR